MQASELVTDFMKLLEAGEVDAACDLLAEDVAYMNVSLPAIHGRERTRRVLKAAFGRKSVGLEVHFHKIGVDGGVDEGTVLTERTDVIIVGPVRIQIWVWGHFDVAGGQITVWKDYFDWWNATVAVVRGLVGAVVPSLRPKPPR
jgi:limonene-1,2-epoxide hydrolase